MKDYGFRHNSSGSKRQKINKKIQPRPGEYTLLWRITGTAVMLALAGGIAASLWFGYRIDSTLGELAVRQEKLEQERERNLQLQRRQEELLTGERVQGAVGGRGLYPPNAEQIRKM